MRRLFLFGIGGTGSRVIKALTYLLATGVDTNGYDIVPIIVDPHQSNEDLKRTITQLKNYQMIRSQIGENPQGFFKTKINTLQDFVETSETISNTFAFELDGVRNEKFKDYIDFSNLDKANKALASLLFSEEHLDVKMDIGFVGNPNIGSVVLNQFKDSKEFLVFANNFQENDRVFIISSIFGGTGAAGFPIILKNIRDAHNNKKLQSKDFLQNARIGAVTVMPYFHVEGDGESAINKSDFMVKTKAALSYYEQNITGTSSSVNALYYVGDDTHNNYKNDPGAGGQKNDAHLIELVSALSIIDFLRIGDTEIRTNNGVAESDVYKDFGIMEDKSEVFLPHLGPWSQKTIGFPLSSYLIFNLYLQHRLNDVIKSDKQAWADSNPAIDSSFLASGFYTNYLTPFNNGFMVWLEEMKNNSRSFAPFTLKQDLNEQFQNIVPKRSLFPGKKLVYNKVDSALNTISKGIGFDSAPKKLMNLFHQATDQLLKKHFEYFKSL